MKKKKKITWRKVVKVLFIIYTDSELLLKKKCDLVKITLKILRQRKKLSTNLQDTHGVQYARLMIQKTDVIFIGEKIVSKSFEKI